MAGICLGNPPIGEKRSKWTSWVKVVPVEQVVAGDRMAVA
jgi:hypothetical protein